MKLLVVEGDSVYESSGSKHRQIRIGELKTDPTVVGLVIRVDGCRSTEVPAPDPGRRSAFHTHQLFALSIRGRPRQAEPHALPIAAPGAVVEREGRSESRKRRGDDV